MKFLLSILLVAATGCSTGGTLDGDESSAAELVGAYRTPLGGDPCPNEDAEMAGARRAIATVRAFAGLAPLRCEKTASAAALGHCRYVAANGGALTHVQKRGHAKFTGASFEDRLKAASFPEAGAGEVMSTLRGAESILGADGYLNSVYHRAFFLRAETTSYGYGAAESCSTIDFGRPLRTAPQTGAFVVWPPDGARNTPHTFYAARELPNPMPGSNAVGAPVSLIRNGALGKVTARLEGPNGEVKAKLLTAPSDPQKLIRTGEAHLVPVEPLAANTVYRATFTIESAPRGDTITVSTSFTTVR